MSKWGSFFGRGSRKQKGGSSVDFSSNGYNKKSFSSHPNLVGSNEYGETSWDPSPKMDYPRPPPKAARPFVAEELDLDAAASNKPTSNKYMKNVNSFNPKIKHEVPDFEPMIPKMRKPRPPPALDSESPNVVLKYSNGDLLSPITPNSSAGVDPIPKKPWTQSSLPPAPPRPDAPKITVGPDAPTKKVETVSSDSSLVSSNSSSSSEEPEFDTKTDLDLDLGGIQLVESALPVLSLHTLPTVDLQHAKTLPETKIDGPSLASASPKPEPSPRKPGVTFVLDHDQLGPPSKASAKRPSRTSGGAKAEVGTTGRSPSRRRPPGTSRNLNSTESVGKPSSTSSGASARGPSSASGTSSPSLAVLASMKSPRHPPSGSSGPFSVSAAAKRRAQLQSPQGGNRFGSWEMYTGTTRKLPWESNSDNAPRFINPSSPASSSQSTARVRAPVPSKRTVASCSPLLSQAQQQACPHCDGLSSEIAQVLAEVRSLARERRTSAPAHDCTGCQKMQDLMLKMATELPALAKAQQRTEALLQKLLASPSLLQSTSRPVQMEM
eukprot:Rmarinus@m.12734